MIAKWKMAEELSYLKRRGVGTTGGTDGPPKFIPFGQKLENKKV